MDGYFLSANVRIMSGRVCQIIGNFKLLAIFSAMFAMFAICHQDIRKNFFLKTEKELLEYVLLTLNCALQHMQHCRMASTECRTL